MGCTQRQCEISKDIVDNYRTMFESRTSAGATENYHARQIWVSLRGLLTWKVMPRNVWSENRLSKQNDSTILQSLFSTHWWPSFQRRRHEICWRIVTSMLTNCSEMLVFDRCWTTWHSVVSEQIGTTNYKKDQSLWQTSELIDFLHSSTLCIQTILSCG